MTHKLNSDIERAVEQNHGFMQVEGQRTSYVVMSIDAYREMMGVGSDEELAASLKAIDEGLADIEAGRTRPFRDVLAELG
jgi:predicted transcriptional regulator